ncbi:MAG TPA: arylamine N-acetyltransferase [Streptosporangiaceae bacterium]|nr:arylamine N-acetyltransferase [Streptosporangiaceae bacterium]
MDDRLRLAYLEAYLERIGVSPEDFTRSGRALDAAALAALHRAHLMTVPFENLSIHLSEPISLDEPDLLAKVVSRRRGGFCYELNGCFALLLEALGAEVTRVAARVYGENGPGAPFAHMALAVRLADGSGPWLADVGFGSHTTYPLALRSRSLQQDPGGGYLLADADGGDLDVLRDGQPQYRLELRGRALADFVPTCWYQQTSPRSHFTRGTICSMLAADGRISISDRTLIRTTAGVRTEEPLVGDAALLAAYLDNFGIALDRAPEVPPG